MNSLIQQMGHVTLGVPDPAASARDLCDIVGLRITGLDEAGVSVSSNLRAHEVVFERRDRPCVLAIGLETVSDEAVGEIEARVRSDGLEIVGDTPLHGNTARAFRFRGPSGEVWEVHSPIAKSGRPDYLGRAKRLEHVNLLVPDVRGSGEFLGEVFGLKVSDVAGDHLLSWHRAADGYHHTVALGPGPGKLHHYAFDLRALEDLARIGDGLAARERGFLWGPGRHGAGGNVFTYYVDPDGCIVENSIEMARIDQEMTHRAGHWPIGEGLSGRWINLWGAGPPPDFGAPGLPFA